MKLLFEEFFGKISDLGKSSPLLMKISIKLVFFIITVVFLYIIINSLLSGNYILILVILGLFILAESAHYIRKLRERAVKKYIASSQNTNKKKKSKSVKSFKKKVKSKALNTGDYIDESLIEGEDSKNTSLLHTTKTKNKSLIIKKPSKNIKVDTGLIESEGSKNTNLLKGSKINNNKLINSKKTQIRGKKDGRSIQQT